MRGCRCLLQDVLHGCVVQHEERPGWEIEQLADELAELFGSHTWASVLTWAYELTRYPLNYRELQPRAAY